MGLDQTWLARKGDQHRTLATHRKVPALNDWMARRWAGLTGNLPEEFNGETMRVSQRLLADLSLALVAKRLDHDASGFFWGSHQAAHDDEIAKAIALALDALLDGWTVEYTADW